MMYERRARPPGRPRHVRNLKREPTSCPPRCSAFSVRFLFVFDAQSTQYTWRAPALPCLRCGWGECARDPFTSQTDWFWQRPKATLFGTPGFGDRIKFKKKLIDSVPPLPLPRPVLLVCNVRNLRSRDFTWVITDKKKFHHSRTTGSVTAAAVYSDTPIRRYRIADETSLGLGNDDIFLLDNKRLRLFF